MSTTRVRALCAAGCFFWITHAGAVYRILLQMFTMGLFDHPNFNSRASNVTSVEHNDLARKLSAASTVLLKNSNTGGSKAPPLPLQKQGQKIAFIGRASDNCFTHSGGSGSVQPSRVVTPMQGAMSKISGSSLTYIDGKDIAAAVALAKAADVAVVFAGTTSSEGYDRSNLNLDDNLDALISAVAAAQPNTVAVLSVPGAIVMPWSQVHSQTTPVSPCPDPPLPGGGLHRHKLHARARGQTRLLAALPPSLRVSCMPFLCRLVVPSPTFCSEM
jgi:beta-glucosidase